MIYHMEDKTKLHEKTKKEKEKEILYSGAVICPECGNIMFPEGGCWFCPVCGYSPCR